MIRALGQHLALLVNWVLLRLLRLLRDYSGTAQGLLRLLRDYSGIAQGLLMDCSGCSDSSGELAEARVSRG